MATTLLYAVIVGQRLTNLPEAVWTALCAAGTATDRTEPIQDPHRLGASGKMLIHLNVGNTALRPLTQTQCMNEREPRYIVYVRVSYIIWGRSNISETRCSWNDKTMPFLELNVLLRRETSNMDGCVLLQYLQILFFYVQFPFQYSGKYDIVVSILRYVIYLFH